MWDGFCLECDSLQPWQAEEWDYSYREQCVGCQSLAVVYNGIAGRRGVVWPGDVSAKAFSRWAR